MMNLPHISSREQMPAGPSPVLRQPCSIANYFVECCSAKH
jgi:hypothetical protein